MAKSKNGGTRAYIRGRIGSDVYSVGKNGKGERQQVVRSLAEQVANPRTQSQMFGRMVMSTVMQTVSALKPIIDHSFDSIAKGQPSISEFIRRNYALVKADAEANPNSNNKFGLNKYQEKGVKPGAYIISNGAVETPAAVVMRGGILIIQLTATTLTIGGLKSALGLSADGYLTGVSISSDGGAKFARVRLDTTLADSTAITSDNVNALFIYEGNVTPSATVYDNSISIDIDSDGSNNACGVIVSEKVNGAWEHNQCVLVGADSPDFTANTALPTYPVGAQMFLNGGEL